MSIRVTPDPADWTEEGYETILQSENTLFDSDAEKTVYNLSLDFHEYEEAAPLLCHSQLGVSGLPTCVDWWPSEPWSLSCQPRVDPRIFPPVEQKTRDPGPIMWPYYATGRYVCYRLYTSTNGPTYEYRAKGGTVDFERLRLKLSIASDCA